jgi:hypothetical protein
VCGAVFHFKVTELMKPPPQLAALFSYVAIVFSHDVNADPNSELRSVRILRHASRRRLATATNSAAFVRTAKVECGLLAVERRG